MLTCIALPILIDNYVWILSDGIHAAVIDPGESEPVLEALQIQSLKLVAILLTHHHSDHIAAVPSLLANEPGIPVFGSIKENIKFVSHQVRGSDRIFISELSILFEVLDTPGHTNGHIAFYSRDARLDAPYLFCGDTIFACGCGRVFEGTTEQMYLSLNRITRLPNDTRICCAHEYTISNILFSLVCDPENASLQEFAREASILRNKGIPTVPTTLYDELQRNPFLRVNTPEIAYLLNKRAGRVLSSGVERFSVLRFWKDVFIPSL